MLVKVKNPETGEETYEENEDIPVVTELPEPVEPDSPDMVILIDDDVPLAYIKVKDPETDDYVYIPEEDVPLALIGIPQMGDNSGSSLWLLLFAASLGGMFFTLIEAKHGKK